MVERKSLNMDGGIYFPPSTPTSKLEFIPSGSTLLDCILGGGFPLGRITNICGPRSVNKTGLCIEACANFAKKFPTGKIWYREAEAAFDENYAETLGMPLDRVEFSDPDTFRTVENMFDDLHTITKENKEPGLYILDSLDSLSDEAELGRGISDGSYGASKARKLSEIFRRIVQPIEKSKINVIFVSQLRDNMNAGPYGEKQSRSGGRSLDYFASQIIWLEQTGQIKKTINKVERTIGINLKAKTKKNKVGTPFRDCLLELLFDYGIDDVTSNVNWLKSVGRLSDIGMTESQIPQLKRVLAGMDEESYQQRVQEVSQKTKQIWFEIEKGFKPVRKKY